MAVDNDNRVGTLEEEFKLIKGELKQTLASVRQYLMESGLPDSEYSTILAAMAAGGGNNNQKVEMKGDLSTPAQQEEEVVEEVDDEPVEELTQDEEETEPEDSLEEQPEELEESTEEEETPGETESEVSQEEEMPQDLVEPQTEYARPIKGVFPSTPKVNLLANLIRWVANARSEIGAEQLATFLEVYGICGHLTPELKEVILHLSDIAQPQSGEAGAADVWSRLILELHGILTGADAPVHPVKPLWMNEKAEEIASEVKAEAAVTKPPEEPFRLKLVLTDNKGKDREFNLNLSPGTQGKDLSGSR